MKPLFVLLIAIALGGSVIAVVGKDLQERRVPSSGETDRRERRPPGRIYPVARNLYVISGGGGNTAVFVTASGVLLVDTKYSEFFSAMMAEVRTVTDKPIVYAINTHSHVDHSGGNAKLPPTTEIVAQANTAARLDVRKPVSPGSPVHVVRDYQDTLTLFSGQDAVELHHFGAAHTDGDTFVVFRAAGVMHAGDVFPGRMPPIVNLERGGHGVSYADVLTKAGALGDVQTIITGHGPVVERRELAQFTALYHLLLDHVRTSMAAGMDKNEAFKSLVVPDEFGDYKMGRAFNTMDEIDRSIRPAWLRRLPSIVSHFVLQSDRWKAAHPAPAATH